MIYSMTGFGKAEVNYGNKSYVITIKSVNSKVADLTIKLPYAHRERENDVRSTLMNGLQRGKIDLFVNADSGSTDQNISVNQRVFKAYLKDLKKSAKGQKVSDDTLFSLAVKMPNVLSQEKAEADESEWTEIEKAILIAMNQVSEFRKKEGNTLEKELNQRLENILNFLENIKQWETERLESVKKKIQDKLVQTVGADGFNRDRLEQELIFYIEKLDITEEKVRLLAHCNLFTDTIRENTSQGRKLGFITQEMGREINTIGSKANHARIQQTVVEMKDELEKIKEQLFNIL